jgi:hypothetical protein
MDQRDISAFPRPCFITPWLEEIIKCFKVSARSVTLSEFNDVNFAEFPNL